MRWIGCGVSWDTTSGSTGTTWVFNYDRGGNMTSKVRYAYTTGALGTALQTITYTYGDANWKDKLTSYNGYSDLTYDAIGNLKTYAGWTYTWEAGRQLKQQVQNTTVVTYEYDQNGMRVQKNVNGTVTNYTYNGKLLTHLSKGSNQLHFYYDAQGRPAMATYNGVNYHYVHNLQGDIIGLVDSAGELVVEYKYNAWGTILGTSTLTTAYSTLAHMNPFRYRGYVYDDETGMYYLRSRYYYPELQRFINADALLGDVGEQLSHNLFAYCGNNPVRNEDPQGNSFWDTLKKVAEATLVVAVVVAAAALIVGTGGGAGFALAGGGVLANTAAASAMLGAAGQIGMAGTTMLLASKVGRDYSENRQKKGTPGDNRKQNAMFDEAVRQLKSRYGINLNKDQIRRLHDAIAGLGYSLKEIIEEGIGMFGG